MSINKSVCIFFIRILKIYGRKCQVLNAGSLLITATISFFSFIPHVRSLSISRMGEDIFFSPIAISLIHL